MRPKVSDGLWPLKVAMASNGDENDGVEGITQ